MRFMENNVCISHTLRVKYLTLNDFSTPKHEKFLLWREHKIFFSDDALGVVRKFKI